MRHRSALPLRELEYEGTVAIDSTGFQTTCMGSFCTEKHESGPKHWWVKARVIIGVNTHIILGVQVTNENRADWPQFASLLCGVKSSGSSPGMVVAYKACLSRANYALADSLRIGLFTPGKKHTISNEVRRARGSKEDLASAACERAHHLFLLRRDQFAARYRLRLNVEVVL
jgi:hypothetical protein